MSCPLCVDEYFTPALRCEHNAVPSGMSNQHCVMLRKTTVSCLTYDEDKDGYHFFLSRTFMLFKIEFMQEVTYIYHPIPALSLYSHSHLIQYSFTYFNNLLQTSLWFWFNLSTHSYRLSGEPKKKTASSASFIQCSTQIVEISEPAISHGYNYADFVSKEIQRRLPPSARGLVFAKFAFTFCNNKDAS